VAGTKDYRIINEDDVIEEAEVKDEYSAMDTDYEDRESNMTSSIFDA
jgi:hypothetical protein